MHVPWWSTVPFVVMLLCVAAGPLFARLSTLWTSPMGQLMLSAVLGAPVLVWSMLGGHAWHVAGVAVEYVQFIVLLLALFTISGGIHLSGRLRPTSATNTAFLGAGAVLASVIGTTGAAMLIIRPLLTCNKGRTMRRHTVVFAIFIVANSGGLLTPLGDPPLFLGMLHGVPFGWTLTLTPQWLMVNALLLLGYFSLDRVLIAREPPTAVAPPRSTRTRLRVEGAAHLVYLLALVAVVMLAPSTSASALRAGGRIIDMVPVREILLVALTIVSAKTGPRHIRYGRNEFTWRPIAEVGAVFAGIFATMVPALSFVRQLAPSLPLNEVTLFVFTGGLSSVLDNAPTYLTFFEMASRLPARPMVAGVYEPYLTAISLAAVLCGALTYIGNGPNFMVKSIAEEYRVDMPSFGGYVIMAARHLLPVLVAMVLVFLAPAAAARWVGIVLTTALVALAARRLHRAGAHQRARGPGERAGRSPGPRPLG